MQDCTCGAFVHSFVVRISVRTLDVDSLIFRTGGMEMLSTDIWILGVLRNVLGAAAVLGAINLSSRSLTGRVSFVTHNTFKQLLTAIGRYEGVSKGFRIES
jgi:hypothetical protein